MFVCILPGKANAIPEMTYVVSGGTLNPTHSFTVHWSTVVHLASTSQITATCFTHVLSLLTHLLFWLLSWVYSYNRLVSQVPAKMAQQCVQWSTLVYPLLLHPNAKLRERAVVAMDACLPVVMSQQNEVAKCLASDLKDVRTFISICVLSVTHRPATFTS